MLGVGDSVLGHGSHFEERAVARGSHMVLRGTKTASRRCMSLTRAVLRRRAVHSLLARELYRRLYEPNGEDWAGILRDSGVFRRVGPDCSIQTNVTITDPPFVSLGRNVRLSGCTIFGHDGSVNMLNRAFGLQLDSVGPVVLGDDVFVGHGAIVLPGVRIGSRVIVAAGAVVSRDLPDDCVAAGVPAAPVRSLVDHVASLRRRNAAYPWRDLLDDPRACSSSPPAEIREARLKHFFGDHAAA